jgi:calcineurin-like phosphoesterase family protein
MDFFTADLHFNHKNIIKYCQRSAFKNHNPFRGGTERLFNDVDEMNEHLVEQWNSVVTDKDTCYVLGDVGFGNKAELITLCNRLNGYKILIYGNHDLRCNEAYWASAGFSETFRLGYGKVLQYKEFDLSHYPYRKSLKEYDSREYLYDHAPEENPKILLHGHVHTQWKTKGNMVNVGVDVWNYRPVSLETIRDLVAT